MVESIGDITRRTIPADRDIWREVAKKAADSSELDKAEFCSLIRGTYKVIGKRAPDNETLQVLFFALHDLSIGELTTAIQRFIRERSSEWLTPQLLRELSGVQQEAETAASDAWVTALEAVKYFGSYSSPDFADPYIASVIQSLGGWVEFCGMNPDELRRFVRARFLTTYKSMLTRRPIDATLQNLTDQTNAAQGTQDIAQERQLRITQRQEQRRIGDAK